MQIMRCQDQPSKTLEEFYGEIAGGANAVDCEGGGAMLALIARLRVLPDNRKVFGLTSHDRLCLLAEDTYKSPWYVIISALNKRNYYVEYLMPASEAPWPHAHVKGEFRSEDEAVQMIIKAMDKSNGWSAR